MPIGKTKKRFVIGFTGKNCAGKTKGVEYVVETYGARLVGFGLLLRAIAEQALAGTTMMELSKAAGRELFLPDDHGTLKRLEVVLQKTFDRDLAGIDKENRFILQELSTNLRDRENGFGDGVLAAAIYERVRNDSENNYAIDSIRREADIASLRKLPFFRLCYVHAGIRVRYQREIARARSVDDAVKSFAQFKREDTQESEVQIEGLRNTADFVIHNHDRAVLEELYARIDREIVHIS